jgi:heme/copper-type cytochrome/quinol oxidase subunit 2
MCLLFSFVPASVFMMLSYFVWYAAGTAQGNRQQFGNYLAIWLLIVAVAFIACGAYVTFTGVCPMDRMFPPGLG